MRPSVTTRVAQLVEARGLVIDSLHTLSLFSEASNFESDPPLVERNGWVEWQRSIRDADLALAGLQPKGDREVLRNITNATLAIQMLESGLAALAQDLLNAALEKP